MNTIKEFEAKTNIGTWEFIVDKNELVWSDETYRIHKVPTGEKLSVTEAINFYHPDDRPKITEAFKKSLQDGLSFCLVLRIINRENEVVDIEATGAPFIVDGVCKSVTGTFKNITNMMGGVAQAVFNYGQLDKTLNQFLIISRTDKNGVITFANDNFCKISKYAEEELIGKTHSIVNSGFHSKEMFKELWTNISNGKAWEGQIKNQAKDGSYYWAQTFIFPEMNSAGEILSYTSFRFDITDKMEMSNEIEREKERATFVSQLASIGEMSASIAHEVNNPLAIIMGYSSKLKTGIDDKMMQEKIGNAIEKASERIRKIVKGLQRASYRSRSEQFEVVYIKDFIHDTLDFCSVSISGSRIELIVENLEEDLNVNCHEIKLSQIIINLINNARDAINQENSKERWIKVQTSLGEDYFELRVTDSGPGVPPELQEKIMESFFTTKEKGKGSGLGLALVNRFVKEHNGKFFLDLESEHTSFVVQIPRNLKSE